MPAQGTRLLRAAFWIAGLISSSSKRLMGRCRCGSAKMARFAMVGGRPVCCSACKAADMCDVVSRRCRCGRSTCPLYALPHEKKGVCCSKCKKDGMVNVVSKRCECGASSCPIFNLPGRKRGVRCKLCRREDDVALVVRKQIAGT